MLREIGDGSSNPSALPESISICPSVNVLFNDSSVESGAGEYFDTIVHQSEAFSYYGILFGDDYKNRRVIKIFLGQQGETENLNEDSQRDVVEVTAAFSEYASNLEQYGTRASLHIHDTSRPDVLPKLKKALWGISASPKSKLQLIWEEIL